MKEYTATELAYKNGYEAGVREFAERVKNAPSVTNCENEWLCLDIDTIAKELIDKQRKEDENAMTDKEALETAKEELSRATYLSECGRNTGIRKIYSVKADWLSVLIYNAEQYRRTEEEGK